MIALLGRRGEGGGGGDVLNACRHFPDHIPQQDLEFGFKSRSNLLLQPPSRDFLMHAMETRKGNLGCGEGLVERGGCAVQGLGKREGLRH